MEIFVKLPAYTYVTIKYQLSKFALFNQQTPILVTLSVLLSLLVVPIFILGLVLSLFYKKLVDVYLKFKLKQQYRGQLRGVDTICCNQSACTPSFFLLIDYKKSLDELRQDFVKLLQECRYSRHEKLFFSWDTFMGYHYYYKNTLSVEDYVVVSNDFNGIKTIRNKQEFADVIVQHDVAPMPDNDHALFHIIIYPQEVSLPNVEGSKLVCFKEHHALADGRAFLSWLMADLADKVKMDATTSHIANGGHSMKQNGCLSQPRSIGKCLIDDVTQSLKQTLLYDKIKMLPTDLTDDNILLGTKLSDEKFICWFSDFSSEYIDKIKAIRKSRSGVSFLDVINTCISCSLQDYYEKHSPEVPSTITGAVVLSPAHYSFRYGDADFTLSNEFSVGGLSFPIALDKTNKKTNKKKEIIEKLNYCQREYQAVKEAIDVKFFYWLTHVFSAIPCQISKYCADNFIKITIGVSSLPGSDRRISLFGGSMVKDIILMAPNSSGTALHFVNCSYINQFKISLTVDKSVVRNFADAQSIIDRIIEKIDFLHEIVMSENR